MAKECNPAVIRAIELCGDRMRQVQPVPLDPLYDPVPVSDLCARLYAGLAWKSCGWES